MSIQVVDMVYSSSEISDFLVFANELKILVLAGMFSKSVFVKCLMELKEHFTHDIRANAAVWIENPKLARPRKNGRFQIWQIRLTCDPSKVQKIE